MNPGEWGLRTAATTAPKPEYPAASLTTKVAGVVVASVRFDLDVGEREAFKRGHWPGAVHIPADELQIRGGPELPRDGTIVID